MPKLITRLPEARSVVTGVRWVSPQQVIPCALYLKAISCEQLPNVVIQLCAYSYAG